MELGDKIRTARKVLGISQQALAERVGVSRQSIALYESGRRQPKNAAIVMDLAKALEVETDYLLSPTELEQMERQNTFLEEAGTLYGKRGKLQAQQLLDQTGALFAGGTLDEADQDAFFRAMTDIYFDAKARIRERASRDD